LRVLMRRHQRQGMKATLSYEAPLQAPIRKGQVVGQVAISIPGLPDMRVPVAAASDVAEGGVFTRMKLGVQGLFASPGTPAPVQRDIGPAETDTPAAP